jgi:small nuclear ribonucleoprotein (snRNP)-like protein
MTDPGSSPLLAELLDQEIVIDLRSPYVCLGTLRGLDAEFLDVADADLHDFRDSKATREVYVYDSARLGIRRNRARVLIRRADVVGITRVRDISES